MAYEQNNHVAANILPLSRATTVGAALAEWAWTGGTEDHGRPTERCELCEQESLRYHFEIRNDLTGHTLNVGSQCILRWQVGVIAGGARLAPAAAKARIDAAVRQMQREACERALRAVLTKEPSAVLQGALDAYRADRPLTPKQINVVFWRLKAAGIEYHASFFRVDLRTRKRIEALRGLREFERARVWTAMTAAQRKAAEGWGIRLASVAQTSH